MFGSSDIVKALTIKITADDITGGTWSQIGKGVKSVLDVATSLNQAWELGAKVYQTLAGAVSAASDAIGRGGDFAEQESGMLALAAANQQNGSAVVESLRSITEGTVELERATAMAATAFKLGYGADQIAVITAFAQKYTDVMGGDVVKVTETIEQALFTGKTKSLAEFGLVVEKGQAMSDVLDQIRSKTEALGPGVFNWSDSVKAAVNSVYDFTLRIEQQLNNILGEYGVGDMVEDFRRGMMELEADAPFIAQGIFVPIKDGVTMVWDLIAGPASITSALVEMFDLGFSQTDTLQTKVQTVIRFIGNSFYDTAIFVQETWNLVLFPLESFLQSSAVIVSKLAEAAYGLSEMTGVSLGGMEQMLEDVKNVAKELSDSRIVTVDTSKLENARAAFNRTLDDAAAASRQIDQTEARATAGLSKVGQAFLETKEKGKEHKKAAEETTKAISDAYANMADSVGESVSSIADVMGKTQEGINQTAGTLASFISDKFDPYSFSGSTKMDELKRLMDKQQAAKDREMEVLKEQAQSQRQLADAMITYSKAPKVIEHRVPDDANTTERFVKTVIGWLRDEAEAEGTMVQG